ncbi:MULTISPECIES: hypothetical protein [Pseudomonas]|jgi:hypothetical protein|uniref:Uncharacterized protein n=1 Tax=Serpens gallinarum TaxID=2763075 RepID=A0ABR8TJR1_9PSED|nr:hypothetical protein [Serpens gallinarum]MBD7976013.1 hypothetical protein [Serpens gallinarum]
MKLSRLAMLSLNRPLREVFWLYGAVPSNLFWASILFLFQRGASLGTLVLLFAALMIYTTWILIQIWLCADNVKNPLFGVMARFLTTAWAINTLLLSTSLLLQRLT